MTDVGILDKSDIQSLQMQLSSVTDSTIKLITSGVTPFRTSEETAKFIQ
jgi:hypothetical protein